MSEFQVLIVSGRQLDAPSGFEVTEHSAALRSIDQLEGIWDQVIARLAALAQKSDPSAVSDADFELSSIEFHIGIEAGLNVGLVTKANASVSLTFDRKTPSG